MQAKGGEKPAPAPAAAKGPPKGEVAVVPDGASCEALLDELTVAVAGGGASAGKDGGGAPLRSLPDPGEFSDAGLDERQWSDRHSALLFVHLFRGLS